ncbi:TPA: PTS sugar transporter subunit IIA [Enterococcus faecalis]|uniref:PTS sugar transporter subunit IIA n=1 Tax=Enterococcus faecalis TaxID=1351 RepID=UPI0018E7CADD|nr:PTS sugar transporter subunit IIA [Enterococcus faecalis]MBJ0372753.1 PTS sugar transporter subunit IIA [Enterococcus faecalis]MBJ1788682.1 PTS sugar transporter subunit IIA [Enterococcus faecalis]HBD0804021.1 PTS sugar transporter subunit IIA [Enterococcus faecalis]HBD0830536.1 PTS sugar transporter subunit IIA [Enterococcus faecalis]HBD0833933.1 PTS sugar transporter subunit IIA [Enterococcus faecalis]
MKLNEMFDLDYFTFNVDADDFIELVNKVSKNLLELNLVNDTYQSALLEREELFPTGLITQGLNIGLPHTDPEHIIKPFVYVVRSKKPIQIRQMGDNQLIDVSNFFFLGIKEPSKQVQLLQTMMNLFMDMNFVSNYEKSKSEEEAFLKLSEKLNLNN